MNKFLVIKSTHIYIKLSRRKYRDRESQRNKNRPVQVCKKSPRQDCLQPREEKVDLRFVLKVIIIVIFRSRSQSDLVILVHSIVRIKKEEEEEMRSNKWNRGNEKVKFFPTVKEESRSEAL